MCGPREGRWPLQYLLTECESPVTRESSFLRGQGAAGWVAGCEAWRRRRWRQLRAVSGGARAPRKGCPLCGKAAACNCALHQEQLRDDAVFAGLLLALPGQPAAAQQRSRLELAEAAVPGDQDVEGGRLQAEGRQRVPHRLKLALGQHKHPHLLRADLRRAGNRAAAVRLGGWARL